MPFALKGNAKKWLYSNPTNSISTCDEFVKSFLKKFYPIDKSAQIRNVINQFEQIGELMWKFSIDLNILLNDLITPLKNGFVPNYL